MKDLIKINTQIKVVIRPSSFPPPHVTMKFPTSVQSSGRLCNVILKRLYTYSITIADVSTFGH